MRHERFVTPGPVYLDLRLPAGEIQLETAEVTETVVDVEPLRDNDASREAVESARIELRERAAGGQEVRVHVEDNGDFRWFGRGAEVRIRVTSPVGSHVELETASADVSGRGRFGNLSGRVASGDLEFDDVGGDADVSAASGDVTLHRVGGEAQVNSASGDVEFDDVGGGVEVNTASGDVVVRRAGGRIEINSASGDAVVHEAATSVEINSASGDQRVDAVIEGDVKLESASGDIRVKVRRGSRLWVDASSRSGEVTSDFELGESAPSGNGPLVELRARSGSGDIHVGRA